MHLIVNGSPMQLPAASRLPQLLALLKLEGLRVAVERNGEIVPRSQYADTELVDHDRIEIVRAIGGG